jgi:hypothetical protein
METHLSKILIYRFPSARPVPIIVDDHDAVGDKAGPKMEKFVVSRCEPVGIKSEKSNLVG